MNLTALSAGRNATLAAVLTVMAGALPNHLTGALAPELQADLGFGDAHLGAAVAASFAASAVITAPAGRFTDQVGPYRALRVGLLFSLAGFGLLAAAPTYALFVAALIFAMPGNAIAQPAANVLISEGVRAERRGMALGMKQSAIAISTGVTGLASAVLAPLVGWRWVFAGGASVVVAGWVLLAATRRSPSPVRGAAGVVRSSAQVATDRTAVWAAALTGLAGAAAVGSIGTFLVRAAVDSGLSATTGRLVLSIGSVVLVGLRIGWGALADSGRINPSRAVTIQLAVGAIGYLLLSTGTNLGFIAGAILAMGAGWSWPGLLILALIRRFHAAPGLATGQVQRGMFFGAMIGPLVFGVVAESLSFMAAWWISAAWGSLAVGASAWFYRLGRE